tara:strand:- start:3609 stop:4295 length:687 start_codon:yes stop_codon:yes gene_type:complete
MNKVSCITVTKNRVPLLKKCIEFFLNQTHQDKELIIVYYNTDLETKEYLERNSQYLLDNNIFFHMFIEDTGLFLGAIRNYAIMKATGDWLCVWDDDDYYSENRIQEQLTFCLDNDVKASTLQSILIYSDKKQEVRLSFERTEGWEGSLFIKRDIMPRYKNLKTGEDTPVLLKLMEDRVLETLFSPDLYIYIFHDNNTSSTRHKESLLDNSYELSIRKTRETIQKLDWL